MSQAAATAQTPSDLEIENQLLREPLTQLHHQLDWFKRQLFGSKSEKRRIEPNPDQLALLGKLPADLQSGPPEKHHPSLCAR